MKAFRGIEMFLRMKMNSLALSIFLRTSRLGLRERRFVTRLENSWPDPSTEDSEVHQTETAYHFLEIVDHRAGLCGPDLRR